MEDTLRQYQVQCKKLINDGLALEELNDYDNFKSVMTLYEFKKVMLEKQRRKNKRYRTKQKYIELLKIKNCMKDSSVVVFGTITLDNKHLNIGLTQEDLFITNVKSCKGNMLYKLYTQDYDMGHEPVLEIIKLSEEDLDATINYLLKLNNHSNKATTKSRVRILKNDKAKYIILVNALEPSKAEKNRIKIIEQMN